MPHSGLLATQQFDVQGRNDLIDDDVLNIERLIQSAIEDLAP
jgi:hypothetical protein